MGSYGMNRKTNTKPVKDLKRPVESIRGSGKTWLYSGRQREVMKKPETPIKSSRMT